MLKLPILAGPLRGYWWAPGAGESSLRVLLGMHQAQQSALFCKHVGTDDVVIDAGAGAGYYTLLAARLVGPAGVVIACEPDPVRASILRSHVRSNRLANTRILEAALGCRDGVVKVCRRGNKSPGSIERGEIPVQVITLDEIVREHRIVPTHLKINVGGAELDALRGGPKTLAIARPMIFVATHGAQSQSACCDLLAESGYDLRALQHDRSASTELLAA
jgi:FkbM family methyltransferase